MSGKADCCDGHDADPVAGEDGAASRHVETDVPASAAGERLDRHLAAVLADTSRARVQAMVREGLVRLDGHCVKDPGRRLKAGETIRATLRRALPAEPAGEVIPLAVVYEDAHLIVIDKPAGLVVHPAPGHAAGTLVNALIAHCGDSLSGIGGVRRPGIVHRLDKDTSGLMVVAKSDAAHHELAAQFAAHGADGRLKREYVAVVWGAPARPAGTIDLPLTRAAVNRTKIAVARGDDGRRAVTHYRVEALYGAAPEAAGERTRRRMGRSHPGAPAGPLAALVRLSLETGRTHQIRVHMAALGHPLLGDGVYGAGFATRAGRLHASAAAALAGLGRQALHATVLGFEHPLTREPLSFESPPPADLAQLMAALADDNPA